VIKNEETLDLFDFDCNLTHDDMVADVEMHMQHGAAAGVTEMLVPGATLEESQAAIDLCRKYPTVRKAGSICAAYRSSLC
jgi:Tat protein secretion system quality control protein TatD with DNase activity